MSRKVVLVSGAAGFIGRWSVPSLRARGYEVHALLGRASLSVPTQLEGATLHHSDLLDAQAVDRLVVAVGATHLLHFAWIATPGEYWTSPDNRRWVGASDHLLRRFRAAGGIRVVCAGSCAEYDWTRAGVCHEYTTALADTQAHITPYAECKIEMQRRLAGFAAEHAVSAAWGRIFFQYGPAEHPSRLVASVILDLLNGREAACTHGRQIRGFLHVADVGAAFAALLDSAVEGAVNIGSDEPVTIAHLVGLIARHIGREDLVRLGARPAVAAEPPLLIADVGRLRAEVGWLPSWTLETGIGDTVAWFRAGLECR